jgi:hypothetical protein
VALCGSAAHADLRRIEFVPPADRAFAAQCLGRLRSVKAVPTLIKLCEDPDGAVRLASVRALGAIGDPRALEILDRIAGDQKQAAVDGVDSFTGRFMTSFAPRFGYGPYGIRRAAQFALLTVSPERGVHHARTELDALDREALRRYGNYKKAPPSYRESGQIKTDYAVYSTAHSLIDVVSKRPSRQVSASLVGLFECGCQNIAMSAASHLSGQPAEYVMPHVRKILAKRHVSPLTLTACLELVRMHAPQLVPGLVKRTIETLKTADDLHNWPRYSFELSLTKMNISHLQALRDARTDPKERAAVEGLISRLRQGTPIQDCLERDAVPPARRAEAIRYVLSELTKAEPDGKTFRAAHHAGHLYIKRAVPALVRLLGGDYSSGFGAYHGKAAHFQTMAGWALTQMRAREALPDVRLICIGHSKRALTRSAAILCYARLASPHAALEMLHGILREKGYSVQRQWRYHVGELFGQSWPVGSTHEAGMAFPAFSDPKEAAAWGLVHVGGVEAQKIAVKVLEKNDWLSLEWAAALHRLVPDDLDQWSQSRLMSVDSGIRACAIGIRYAFYPATTADLAVSLLSRNEEPLLAGTLVFLRRYRFGKDRVTRALVDLLGRADRTKSCNLHIKILDAIACQGGEVGEEAILSYALNGPMKPTK